MLTTAALTKITKTGFSSFSRQHGCWNYWIVTVNEWNILKSIFVYTSELQIKWKLEFSNFICIWSTVHFLNIAIFIHIFIFILFSLCDQWLLCDILKAVDRLKIYILFRNYYYKNVLCFSNLGPYLIPKAMVHTNWNFYIKLLKSIYNNM